MSNPFVSDVRRSQALGEIPKSIEPAFRDLTEFFSPLMKPGPQDWLASQPEPGQTFPQFPSEARLPTSKRNKIYILPLDPNIDTEMLEFLKSYSEAFFQPVDVRVMSTIPVDELQVESRDNHGVRQYHAAQIIGRMQGLLPRDAFCMIGITLEDLYPRDSWNFVFGLASKNTGVFSFCRYVEGACRELVLFRSAKVMTHEICHMFGIKHCVYYLCAMNGSMHAEEAASRPAHLCPVCLLKLHHCLKFNIPTRYRALAAICSAMQDPKFTEESEWYTRRAASIDR